MIELTDKHIEILWETLIKIIEEKENVKIEYQLEKRWSMTLEQAYEMHERLSVAIIFKNGKETVTLDF